MALSKYLKMAQQALHTEQGRKVGRQAVDRIEDAANRATSNKHASKVDKAADAARTYLGGSGDTGGAGAPKR